MPKIKELRSDLGALIGVKTNIIRPNLLNKLQLLLEAKLKNRKM